VKVPKIESSRKRLPTLFGPSLGLEPLCQHGSRHSVLPKNLGTPWPNHRSNQSKTPPDLLQFFQQLLTLFRHTPEGRAGHHHLPESSGLVVWSATNLWSWLNCHLLLCWLVKSEKKWLMWNTESADCYNKGDNFFVIPCPIFQSTLTLLVNKTSNRKSLPRLGIDKVWQSDDGL